MVNGEKVTCELTGDIDLEYKNKDDKSHIITLIILNYVPLFWCNLFSITSAMEKVIDLLGSGKSLLLKYKTDQIVNIEFNKTLKAETGFLCVL